MLHAGGYLVTFSPDAPVIERDTVTCNHCQKLIIVAAGQNLSELGGYCSKCDKHICKGCEAERVKALGVCKPWLKRLDEMEARAAHEATRGY